MGCFGSSCEEEGQDPSTVHWLQAVERGLRSRIGTHYRGLMIYVTIWEERESTSR